MGPFCPFWGPKMENALIFGFFDYFSPKTLKCPFFHFCSPLAPSGAPPPPSSGSRLGDGWEGFGRRLGDVREPSGRGLGDVWETFGRRLGPHRWPELETTARPGEESSGGGGAAWGSRRCGSGQPAVPAGGISPLSRVGASARQGRRSFRFTPIPAGGLLVKQSVSEYL